MPTKNDMVPLPVLAHEENLSYWTMIEAVRSCELAAELKGRRWFVSRSAFAAWMRKKRTAAMTTSVRSA